MDDDAGRPDEGLDPEDELGEDSERQERRRQLERVFREAFRRAIERGVEAGVGTFSRADKAVRGAIDDVPLPKEIVGVLFSQFDDTKNALVRVVANEVRDFLEATDVAGELQRALTSLSFEIKTEVRFIPNEAGGVKPQVRAKAAPKVKREKRGSEPPEAPESVAPSEPGDAER